MRLVLLLLLLEVGEVGDFGGFGQGWSEMGLRMGWLGLGLRVGWGWGAYGVEGSGKVWRVLVVGLCPFEQDQVGIEELVYGFPS